MRRPIVKGPVIYILFCVPLQVMVFYTLSMQAALAANTGPPEHRAELFMGRMKLIFIESAASFLLVSAIVVLLTLRARKH